jgi:hypothetical protein
MGWPIYAPVERGAGVRRSAKKLVCRALFAGCIPTRRLGSASFHLPRFLSCPSRPGVMAVTKGDALADETKENEGDRCNTPTRPPARELWRAAPELDELKEVIGTRAQVLAAIKLQARRHAIHGA